MLPSWAQSPEKEGRDLGQWDTTQSWNWNRTIGGSRRSELNLSLVSISNPTVICVSGCLPAHTHAHLASKKACFRGSWEQITQASPCNILNKPKLISGKFGRAKFPSAMSETLDKVMFRSSNRLLVLVGLQKGTMSEPERTWQWPGNPINSGCKSNSDLQTCPAFLANPLLVHNHVKKPIKRLVLKTLTRPCSASPN